MQVDAAPKGDPLPYCGTFAACRCVHVAEPFDLHLSSPELLSFVLSSRRNNTSKSGSPAWKSPETSRWRSSTSKAEPHHICTGALWTKTRCRASEGSDMACHIIDPRPCMSPVFRRFRCYCRPFFFQRHDMYLMCTAHKAPLLAVDSPPSLISQLIPVGSRFKNMYNS